MEAAAQNGVESDLRGLASRIVGEAGLELVELIVRRSGRRQLLRLDIDRAGARGATLSDCERVSRALGAALDETDLIPSSYVLEVSSPGADRPIRSEDDIRRNTGRRIVVKTNDPVEGERSYRGVLLGAADGCMVLSEERGHEIRIPLEGVVRAQQELEI